MFFQLLHKKDTVSNSNKESDSEKKLARNLQAATAKKWKSTTLAKYNADDWLVVNVNKTINLVQSMNCSVCTKFMDRISFIKDFQQQWCESGS